MSYQTNQENVLAALRATLGNISADQVERLIARDQKRQRTSFLSALAGCCCHCRQWQNGWRIWVLKPTSLGKLPEPAITERDLLIVGGSGESMFPLALPEKRKAFMQALCILAQIPKAV
ncbi:hypothetical protein ACLB1E_07770 [Escherichia coli]